jgi:iron complex transport system substrate-binding protein
MKPIIPILTLCLLASCTARREAVSVEPAEPYAVRYAQGYDVVKADSFTLVTLRNPWDTTQLLRRLVLVDRQLPLPASLPEGTLVRTPVANAVAYTTTQCGALDELGVISAVSGVCEPQYIAVEAIREGVASGKVANLGQSSLPDVEQIIRLHPDLIMTSPYPGGNYASVERLGIPLFECTDYMESTPLGRAEWIRLFGLLFGAEAKADSLFDATEARYLDLRRLTADVANRPTLLAEKKTGPAWYVAGGNSYMGNLYKDAGADYLWGDTPQTGSIPLSLEEVIDKAHAADVWLIKYNDSRPLTLADLEAENALYTRFDAFKNRRIYTCNSGVVPYFEEMPLHPDHVLSDLILILHPELLPGKEMRYFRLIGD